MKFAAVFLAALSLAPRLPAADLPSGESILAHSIASEGGVAALKHAETAVMTGTVEVLGHNISGPLEMYQEGEKAYTAIDIPGIGKVEEGFDGKIAWDSNLLQGPRIKEGEELEAARRSARISFLTDWKQYYKSAVTTGSEEVNGKPAWKVAMTPTAGAMEYFYFDKASGLMVKMTQTLPTALGEIPVEVTLSDYRVVEGVQTPFLMTQKAMGQDMAMHIEKVTYGVKIPASRFELPAEVKALLAKKP